MPVLISMGFLQSHTFRKYLKYLCLFFFFFIKPYWSNRNKNRLSKISWHNIIFKATRYFTWEQAILDISALGRGVWFLLILTFPCNFCSVGTDLFCLCIFFLHIITRWTDCGTSEDLRWLHYVKISLLVKGMDVIICVIKKR